jgi:hypothetical protein
MATLCVGDATPEFFIVCKGLKMAMGWFCGFACA